MDTAKLKKLKKDVLSLLTDKNVGKIDYQCKDEEFGALMAYTQAFNDVLKVFEKYNL